MRLWFDTGLHDVLQDWPESAKARLTTNGRIPPFVPSGAHMRQARAPARGEGASRGIERRR
ncbi:hypothetical protein A5892_03955 [Halotalea alkalilenta]|uniref:Uncharacterized protein n=1 Tax=Halotalea alkalilenta TaxID=376489 RepID=A0A172YCJ6_9GAMM|nr:hypothetical protein A5892_03955 [Halotalea alkalilenta]